MAAHVIVRVHLDALARNARRAREAGARFADVRRDAWGHGLACCAPVLSGAGLALVGDTGDGAPPPARTADPGVLWGLPDGDGEPVLSLHGRLLSTKRLLRGEGVSYGYRHRAAHDTRVGLVAGGYAQGVVRELGGRVTVQIAGGRAPIIGRVAMDACVVDMEGVDAAAGADVVFFGDPRRGEPDLAEWVRVCGMMPAEIVSLAGARARREAVA